MLGHIGEGYARKRPCYTCLAGDHGRSELRVHGTARAELGRGRDRYWRSGRPWPWVVRARDCAWCSFKPLLSALRILLPRGTSLLSTSSGLLSASGLLPANTKLLGPLLCTILPLLIHYRMKAERLTRISAWSCFTPRPER